MNATDLLPAGYTVLRTEAPSNAKPTLTDLWYPAAPTSSEAAFDYGTGATGQVSLDAPPMDDLAPVIVVSHGIYGTARNYTWLTEELARQGFIVAGVSHDGESAAFGPQTMDSTSTLKPWQRPRDCTAALDLLLSHERFGAICDPMRIGAIGHSTGGAAVIALAGAVYDPEAMREYCRSEISQGDRGCRFATGVSVEDDETARQSWRDERVRVVVALDPALGPGTVRSPSPRWRSRCWSWPRWKTSFSPSSTMPGATRG